MEHYDSFYKESQEEDVIPAFYHSLQTEHSKPIYSPNRFIPPVSDVVQVVHAPAWGMRVVRGPPLSRMIPSTHRTRCQRQSW